MSTKAESKNKFNPQEHMITLKGEENTNKRYLEVKWRMYWFREENPNGLVKIELMKCTDTEAVAKAEVYLDKEDAMPIAVNFGSAIKGQEFRYVESACTYAKGRALADAGYNVVDETTVDEDELNICDAPVELKGTATPLPTKTPERSNVPAELPRPEDFEDASTEPDNPFLQESQEISIADALQVLIPCGAYEGKPLKFLYDLANKDEMLNWHIDALKENPAYADFVKACKVLVG